MTASSTSQSTFCALRGIFSASSGPTIDVVDLKNSTGSLGGSALVSAAWSRKFRPMQTILLGRQMGGPRRADSGTRGADEPLEASHNRNFSKPPEAKKLSLKSELNAEASRRTPSFVRIPGLSAPAFPQRISFMRYTLL